MSVNTCPNWPHSVASISCASSHAREYMPHPTPPPTPHPQRSVYLVYFMCKFTWTIMNVNTCPDRQPQLSIYFMREFTWTTMNVNTCPNRQSQRSIYFMRKFTWTIMNVNTCPNRQPQRSIYFMRKFTWAWTHTPPHPNKTPWPSKGRGPTTFFTIYIYMNAIRIVAMVWVSPIAARCGPLFSPVLSASRGDWGDGSSVFGVTLKSPWLSIQSHGLIMSLIHDDWMIYDDLR